MLLIALAAGTVEQRTAIADHLVASGKGQLVAFAQTSPAAEYEESRARILSDALAGLSDGPEQLGGVIVAHCMTEGEAEIVRTAGGVVWHVYGFPSSRVVIRHGDAIVTDEPEGFRHVLTPLEALSDLMLSRLPGAKLAMAALAGLANG